MVFCVGVRPALFGISFGKGGIFRRSNRPGLSGFGRPGVGVVPLLARSTVPGPLPAKKGDMDGGCQDSRSPRSILADAPDAKTARNLPARSSGTGGTGMAVRFKTQDQWQSEETMPGESHCLRCALESR